MSDVALAKPFVQATINVLSSMTGLSPVPGKPYVKKTDKAQGDVSAIVGITAVSYTHLDVYKRQPLDRGKVRP